MAILGALGIGKIRVRTMRGFLQRIERSEVDQWKYVQDNKCSRKFALQIFDHLANARGKPIEIDRHDS